MKGREGRAAPSADLLVCFPSRAHLTLMPKPICSPARPSEPNKRNHTHSHHSHLHHYLKKSSHRASGAGQASPLLWAKTKPTSSEISEPTSPKVTCSGQIKVRPKSNPCKNWQSVMEEIERLHNNRKSKKRLAWVEALGFKKDITQFLTCLRSIRFDFRCFGSFPSSDITSGDEGDDEEDEDYQENQKGIDCSDDNEASRTVFSKWFMVLQENQNNECVKKEMMSKERDRTVNAEAVDDAPSAPPPNALLLMRCRSAPAKSWLGMREENNNDEDEEEVEEDEDEEEVREDNKNAKVEMEKAKREKKENLVVMRNGSDFYKFSSDISKETWVVGGIRDPISRSRSWKR